SLRDRETRLRLVTEQMPAVLWTIDCDLRITSSVGAGLAPLGLRPNQVVGQSLYEFFGTSDPEFLPIAASRRAVAGESVTFELTWQGRTYHAHLEPFFDRRGQSSGAIGVALDITERKQAEEALRESSELHRNISELISDYAYTCTVDPDGTIKIDSVTEGFTRVTGFTRDEVEARGGWETLIHPDDLPATVDREANLLAGQRDVNELRIVTKDGQ